MTFGLTGEEKKRLHRLGLQLDFSEKYFRNSYLAVLDGGELKYERASPEKITYTYEYEEGNNAKLLSSGFVTSSLSECVIGGKNYAVNRRGINIVVYDKKSGLLIDSVALDTYDPVHHSVTHSEFSGAFFKQYTDYILSGET